MRPRFLLRRELAILLDGLRNLIVRRPIGSIRLGYVVVTPRLYPGWRPLRLGDGTVIRRGDRIARLDLKVALPRLRTTELRYVRAALPEFEREFRALAYLAERHPRLVAVVAFVGQSHLIGGVTERLGLETRPITNPIVRRYVDVGGRLAMVFVNPTWSGLRKSLRGPVRPPREGWISRRALVERHRPLVTERRT